MPAQKIQKQNIGNAGEYYIAARLSAENFIATITLGRAEQYDILALSPSGRLIKLSVKARLSQETTSFTLSDKAEKYHNKDFFYVFIRLHEFKREPDFWIIPSKRVTEITKTSHAKWHATPGKRNQQRNDTPIRKIPLFVRGQDKMYYPANWEGELKKYYKNIKQLR